MTKVSENIESIYAAMRDAEPSSEDFFMSLWREGDGHSGYVLTTDGTLMPFGDYAGDVLHLDDFVRDAEQHASLNTTESLRHLHSLMAETDNILKNITPLTESEREELEDEYLPFCFNDSDLVSSALLEKSTSFLDLFDLYHMCPGTRAHEGNLAKTHKGVLREGLTVSGITQSATGELIWQSTDIPQGHPIEGRLGPLGFRMNTSYGHVILKPNAVEDVVQIQPR